MQITAVLEMYRQALKVDPHCSQAQKHWAETKMKVRPPRVGQGGSHPLGAELSQLLFSFLYLGVLLLRARVCV